MNVPQTAAEVLRDHVTLETESIDRMYLNAYVPQLQSVGGVVGYLHTQKGQRFASTAAVAPMTEEFLRAIERFAKQQGVDVVHFEKWQRKDDVTRKYLARFRASEGVLYIGKAQEKARVMRTERRRNPRTGASYPWIVASTAMVNHVYFYCVDQDFGPFFLKARIIVLVRRSNKRPAVPAAGCRWDGTTARAGKYGTFPAGATGSISSSRFGACFAEAAKR